MGSHFSTRLHSRRARAGAVFVIPCMLVACGGSPAPNDSARYEATGTVASADTSTSVELCNLVNALKKYFVTGNSVSCNEVKESNLYFNGAEPLTNSLQDLYLVPVVTEGAYFCAIADSGGASVDGRLSTEFGTFGVTSKFNVTTRDPPNRHVHGQRVGSFSLFGISANLEVQDIDWVESREETTGSPTLLGSYMQVTGDSSQWSFSGTVDVPVGPLTVSLTPKFQSWTPVATMTNDGIQFSGVGVSPTLSPDYQYTNWLTCANNASSCQDNVTSSEATLFEFEHQIPCPTNIADLTDGILPFGYVYGGPGCSSQNWVFTDTLTNWFHFGEPAIPTVTGPVSGPGFNSSGTPVTVSEPSANLTIGANPATNATISASLDVSYGLETDIANITVDTTVALTGRDGFAVRQQHSVPEDSAGVGVVALTTDLNAQTTASLTLSITVDLGGGLLPGPFTLSDTFNLGSTGNREAFATSANPGFVSMQYPDGSNSSNPSEPLTSLESYAVKGVAKSSSADGSRLSCVLQSTATNTAVQVPDNPQTFINNIAHQVPNSVHPCNVIECSADGSKESDYEWNGTQLALKSTSTPCGICTTFQMNVCNANGTLLTDSTNSKITLTSTQGVAGDGCLR